MEIENILYKASWLLALIAVVNSLSHTETLHVTRNNDGDQFATFQETTSCSEDTCIGMSSGTASAISRREMCTCRCHPHLPAFREDLRICVDDIHECVLAPFVGGSTSQQIPFVFLPLKGQIIHPSKEISFAEIQTSVCAVTGAKFLTESGWSDLRDPVDANVPFSLFRDEGRTFLQWIGDPELRHKMSGRLILVHLICREQKSSKQSVIPPVPAIFSPCVAFRVVGTPSKHYSNVSEIAFSLENRPHEGAVETDHLSVSEYVAIGVSSVLLGLIYVASVFLYLHLKKKKSNNANKKIDDCDDNLAAAEEGIVKNNPLLSYPSHFMHQENIYSDTNSSDNEIAPDIIQNHDDRRKNSQITSAMIHPQHHNMQFSYSARSLYSYMDHQDNSNIERLPEENVSIVETLEGKEDYCDSLKAITGTARKKLYFNPAYFEPHLLLAPPPAALEFLFKIREVISVAKQKMASKRFQPTLLNIPEEENAYSLEPIYEFASPTSRRGSNVSLKRENSRRKNCTGCPGCEPDDFRSLCGKLPLFPSLGACENCSSNSESKQRSIRKWLENVPILKSNENTTAETARNPKRVRSPTRSLPPDSISSERALSPRPSSEQNYGKNICHQSFDDKMNKVPNNENKIINKEITNKENRTNRITKPTAPPPPTPFRLKPIRNRHVESYYDTVPEEKRMNFPPPDMIHEAMAVDSKAEGTARIPSLTKKQMNAVINEFTVHRNIIVATDCPPPKSSLFSSVEYETDSLERTGNKGYSTPSEYAEVSSSQPSPSLSAALPCEEEITMRNAVFNKRTGNMTISKISMDHPTEDEHEYELIVMKKGNAMETNLYNLPELLQRNSEYSLVSEVYVNNGYNNGSLPSTPGGSNCSTLERRTLKVRYDGGSEKPGKLLIEVEDCPDNYIPVHDSDGFEPDTLDRKPVKTNFKILKEEFVDSLERPSQILLRTTGSFRSESVTSATESLDSSNFNRVLGSLREIYEAKSRGLPLKSSEDKEERILSSLTSEFEDDGRLLTLEERHSKRQRVLTTSKGPVIQPDVIPPPPRIEAPIYEHPKPPRKILINDALNPKPPLPSKNLRSRSANHEKKVYSSPDTPEKANDEYELCVLQKSRKNGNITNLIQTEDVILRKNEDQQYVLQTPLNFQTKSYASLKNHYDGHPKNGAKNVYRKVWLKTIRPEDSGYLSTDSNESRNKKLTQDSNGPGSETDESLGDGHSESGAESVETHSVFFGRFHRTPQSYAGFGSMDSGVIGGEEGISSDSETVSYTTVVPVGSSANFVD